jgi:ubiquitin carboxyl-terminal hydrolase 5/13
MDWIFNNETELIKLNNQNTTDENKIIEKKENFSDGSGKYELIAMISHMGTNLNSGHYICHIKKDNIGWVKFNDSIVESCENPPLDMGYVYFYKRK